ncbi:MAG: tetratricopeptide repeat protein, partial [Pirellulales bacterium]
MSFIRIRFLGLSLCTLILQCCIGLSSAHGQLGFDQDSTVPRQSYDLAETTLTQGNYQGALQLALKNYQGAMRFGGQRWIDSIAAASLVGECHYELGNLQEAFVAYEDAMRLAVMSGDWLMSVQFPNQRLQGNRKAPVATWGRTTRKAMPASFPEVVTIRIGSDVEQVLKQGGVLAGPVNYPIRPQVIMRALTIAIYRYASIMGDLAEDRIVLENLIRCLEKRSAPPNHYSQSWVNVALGMATWAQGRSDEALKKLKAGLLADNQFDHELSSWALLGLGRIAIESGNDAEAAKLFEEATYTAADFGDPRALEEAFHWVNTAYLAAGSQGTPATLTGAATWSKGKLPILHCRLQAAQAEHLVLAGDPQLASKILSGVDRKLLQGDSGRGVCGAEVFYSSALVAYGSGNTLTGDHELLRSIEIIKPRSVRLFQTLKLVEWTQAALISDREANEKFHNLLEDPDPRYFTLDPVGTLASISTPRQLAYETWIAVAVNRSLEEGQAAAEVAARARWLQSQPLGGRQNAIEKLLYSHPDTLSELDADRRSSMLARYPQVAAALNQM